MFWLIVFCPVWAGYPAGQINQKFTNHLQVFNLIIKTMKTEFYNKNEDLTKYGFSCGYIQRKENETKYKEMYKEHTVYHVKGGTIGNKWEIWETFEPYQLTKARKFYKSIKL